MGRMDEHSWIVDDEGGEELHAARPRPKRPRWRLPRSRAILVTDARQSPEENRHHRQRVYYWMQASRLPFLLASGIAYVWWHNLALSAVLFLICVPLPWIAVVIANGVGERRDPRSPAVYKPAAAREYQEYVQLHQSSAQAVGRAEALPLPPVPPARPAPTDAGTHLEHRDGPPNKAGET